MPTSRVIKLPGVRLSFARLDTAKSFEEGDDARYEATFLLDPTHAVHAKTIKEIKSVAGEIIKEHWGGKIPKGMNYCFGKGDDKEYDGYAGMFYIASAKKENRGRVVIVDKDKSPLQPGDENFPYSGCYVHASITLWTNEHKKGGKRVSANLRAIQFFKNGEAFSGEIPVDTDSEFDDQFDDQFDDLGIDDDDFGESDVETDDDDFDDELEDEDDPLA